MKKTIYILLAAMGFASCNYLEIEPVGKVIPHKTSEFRALLTEGYQSFPFYCCRMKSEFSSKASSIRLRMP